MNATHAIPKTSHRNPIDCVVTFIKKKIENYVHYSKLIINPIQIS